MSNNKYIIDKDSLTGIADAVRNKLGVGEVTTDPQTGDIVYPEGKGYYIDSVVTTMFIEVPDNNEYSISSGTRTKDFIRCTNSDYLTKVEKPVSEIEVEGIFGSTATGSKFKRYIVINSNSFQLDDSNTTNIQNFKQTFDTPQTYLTIYISVTNNYARTQSIRWSNVKIYLRDENGNLIDLITSGFPYNGCTIGTTTSQIQKPIPYSISDITDNIEDYWNVPSGVSIPVPLQTHMNWGSSATTDYSSFWYDFDCTNISSLTFKYKALLPYNSNTGVKAQDLKFNLDVYYGSKIWHKSGSNERAGVTAVDNASLCSTEHEIVDFDFPNETAAGEGVYTTGDYSHTINVPNNTWITLNIKLSYGSNSYHKIGQLILYDFSVVPREA